MPSGVRASAKSASLAAAVLRSSDCAESMQETTARNGSRPPFAAGFGGTGMAARRRVIMSRRAASSSMGGR